MKPLFGIGDEVSFRDKWGVEMQGEVKEIERAFKRTLPIGAFDENGLVTLESVIPSLSVPHRLEGDELIVDGAKSKFFSYAYTVDAGDFLVVILEKQCEFPRQRA